MANKIKELRAANAKIHADAQAKLDEITDEIPNERSAEINREFDAMMVTYDDNEAKIARLQKLVDNEAREAARETDAERRAREANRPGLSDAEADALAREAENTPEYQEVFRKAIARGFPSLSQEEAEVFHRAQRHDSEAEERVGMQVGMRMTC